MTSPDLPQAAIDAAAENVTAFMLKWGWLDYLGSEEKIRSVCRAVATDAISGAAPHLAAAAALTLGSDHYVIFTSTGFAIEHPPGCPDTLEAPCAEREAVRRVSGNGKPIGGRWRLTGIDSAGLPNLERLAVPEPTTEGA